MQRPYADLIAIGLSGACLIHCLALPVVIALLPAWSEALSLPESFHVWMLAIAAPWSLFFLARQRHTGRATMLTACAGLGTMALALLWEGQAAEPIVTTIGAAMLASAHVINWRCRRNCNS